MGPPVPYPHHPHRRRHVLVLTHRPKNSSRPNAAPLPRHPRNPRPWLRNGLRQPPNSVIHRRTIDHAYPTPHRDHHLRPDRNHPRNRDPHISRMRKRGPRPRTHPHRRRTPRKPRQPSQRRLVLDRRHHLGRHIHRRTKTNRRHPPLDPLRRQIMDVRILRLQPTLRKLRTTRNRWPPNLKGRLHQKALPTTPRHHATRIPIPPHPLQHRRLPRRARHPHPLHQRCHHAHLHQSRPVITKSETHASRFDSSHFSEHPRASVGCNRSGIDERRVECKH